MRRFLARGVIATCAVLPTIWAGGAPTSLAAPSSSQWEAIDAPAADATSAYQDVEPAPDGSIYVAGWHRFPQPGLDEAYETIVRKYDAAGGVVWTTPIGGFWSTEPQPPMLVVDGLGNPYAKLCRTTCTLTAFNPANGQEVTSISDSGIQNSSPPIGVKAGGVLVVSRVGGAPTTLAARRLSAGLDGSWSFDLTGKLDANPNTWLIEAASGSFWAIGHAPGSDDVMRLVHFDGSGGALGTPVEHTGGTPFDEAWGGGDPSNPISHGPGDSVWITVDPPGNDLFDQRGEAFSLATGARLGNVDPFPPKEQVPYLSGYVQCDFQDTDVLYGGLLTGTQLAPRFPAGMLGSSFATVMRCLPLGGGDPVAIMTVYTTSSVLGGWWVRVGQLPFPPDSAVSDIAVDATGGLLFAGSTTSASPQAWFLTPPGPTGGSASVPRAALARNPTGRLNADFHSLTPGRLFDTRPSEPNGLVVVPKTRLTPSSDLRVRVSGIAGIPANGAGSVSLNVTVTNPQAAGFVTAYPCGVLPLASNLNFAAGQTVANAVVAPVSANGEVCFHANVETDLLADVNGWFRDGGSFHPLAPRRVFDTRPSEPDGALHVDKRRYGGAAVLTVRVGDVPGVPVNASAVSLNVTATDPLGSGFVTVYPCGDRPLSSNVNFTAGRTVPNAVVTPLGADSVLCFYAHADTHLIADINGYFESAVSFHPLSPTRVFDTRAAEPDGAVTVTKQQYGGNTVLTVHMSGAAGIPATDVGAVSLNVTVTNPVAPGFVTVYPCGERPLASNVNFTAGQTVPNAVVTPVSPAGDVCFYAHANTDLIADVNGWFQS